MAYNYNYEIRKDILGLLEKQPNGRFLEIGCGGGDTLSYLKNLGYCSETFGVEICSDCNPRAERLLDGYLNADIEISDIASLGRFQCILLLDILEHLRAPEVILKKLIENHLEEDGNVIVSIPNIRNINVLSQLIVRGKWEYSDHGILDKTHLRFFTRRSALKMIKDAGGTVVVEGHNWEGRFIARVFRHLPWFSEFCVCQFLFKIKKMGYMKATSYSSFCNYNV